MLLDVLYVSTAHEANAFEDDTGGVGRGEARRSIRFSFFPRPDAVPRPISLPVTATDPSASWHRYKDALLARLKLREATGKRKQGSETRL
jgi:hypothetical protein